MEKQSGIKGIATLKPASVDELAVLNSTIRLMAQEGQNEMPTDKLARFKNSPEAWDKELELNGLGPAEKRFFSRCFRIHMGYVLRRNNSWSWYNCQNWADFL